MRPTREGRPTPIRPGVVSVGVGIDPDAVTEDPEPPTDRLSPDNGGTAFVPFLNPTLGTITIVQYKQSTSYTATFDATPTPGNKIIALLNNQQGTTTLDMSVGGLTTIGANMIANSAEVKGAARHCVMACGHP